MQSPDDKLDSKHEDGGKSWRNSNENKVDVDDEHVEGRCVGANYVEIPKVYAGGDYQQNVDEIDGFSEEILLLFGLVADGSEKFASQGVVVGLGHQAD